MRNKGITLAVTFVFIMMITGTTFADEFHTRLRQGKLNRVKVLIKQNQLLLQKMCYEGDTPLHDAVYWNHKRIVEFLLSEGADINNRNRNNETPLFTAARNGRTEMIILLLDKGADTSLKNTEGLTAKDVAKKHGREDIVKLFD